MMGWATFDRSTGCQAPAVCGAERAMLTARVLTHARCLLINQWWRCDVTAGPIEKSQCESGSTSGAWVIRTNNGATSKPSSNSTHSGTASKS